MNRSAMESERIRVLFVSELFPNPASPVYGSFVERQALHLLPYCDVEVVAPVRVFPHLRIWRHILRPTRFIFEWRKWVSDLRRIPTSQMRNGMTVWYPRYASPPKQCFHGTWGFFAYPFVRGRLRELYQNHRFDVVHAHYAIPSGVIALLARRWTSVPVVLSIHGADITYTAQQNWVSRAIIRRVFERVNIIVANSNWTARRIGLLGGEEYKIRVVKLGASPPSGVSIRPWSPGLPVKLLSVGYLEERKGHAYVLRAVRELVDEGFSIKYVIVGDGSKREELVSLTRRLNLENHVTFEGQKSPEEVWAYFDDCDIFVLPSWNEAFGLVYIEALAIGKPVIGCEGEGGPEELRNLGDCIELVRPRDVPTLVAALRRLLEDPERGRRMAEVGREIVRRHFSWQKNALDTVQLYREALSDARSTI